MICTFFGHREVHNCNEIASKLYDTIYELVENRGVKTFFVGNNGNFDRLVLEVLRTLSKTHDIDYSVVLSYLKVKKDESEVLEASETMYPEMLEEVPQRYAIDKRNRWMIGKSDIVVTYVNTCIGGAVKYAEICEKKGMEIIKLGKI